MEIRSLNALRTVLSHLGDGSTTRQFVRFWNQVLQAIAQSEARGEQSQAENVRLSLQALLGFLEAGMPEDETAAIRQRITGATTCVIPISELPGDVDDPTTPVGFYRLLDPLWSGDDDYTLHLPHAFSLLETTLQGSAMVAASMRSANKETSSGQIEVACRTAKRLHEEIGQNDLGSLYRQVSFAVDEAFLRTPFLSLERPEDFYRHGCRYYAQGELDYFKCGVTSGFVIPEEYYGERVYEAHGPGITQEPFLKPGCFGLESIANLQPWTELVATSLAEGDGSYDALTDHPYRPLYFDSALDRLAHKGGHFHNLIDVERTGLRLRERAEHWDERGQLSAYLQDASAILAYFLCAPSVSVYFVRSLDSSWRNEIPKTDEVGQRFGQSPIAAPFITSLLSDRICVYTSRGALRSINRGFWVNPHVLDYLQPASQRGWEVIPFYLLGLSPKVLQELLNQTGDRRVYWLGKYIQAPTRALFREANRVELPKGKRTQQQAMAFCEQIIDELLRPDLMKMLRPETRRYLSLADLPEVFGRSYGRLRHWIRDYNLGFYSDQKYEHRFSRSDLESFVNQELAGRRGFGEQRIEEIRQAIERTFRNPDKSRKE